MKYYFTLIITFTLLNSFGQSSPSKAIWNEIDIVKLDTIVLDSAYSSYPVTILYNYYKDMLSSSEGMYTEIYKAIQINTNEGVARYENDKILLDMSDYFVSGGMRITHSNFDIEYDDLKFETVEINNDVDQKDQRFSIINYYDRTARLFYYKPRIEIGDIIEVYIKTRPRPVRIGRSIMPNEIFPIWRGKIELANEKKAPYRFTTIATNTKEDQIENYTHYTFHTLDYGPIYLSDNYKNAIPLLQLPSLSFLLSNTSEISFVEDVRTLGWENLIEKISTRLDPVKTMKSDWNLLYNLVDSLKEANFGADSYEVFKDFVSFTRQHLILSEMYDDSYMSPGYYIKKHKINKESVIRMYIAALKRLEIPFQLGVSRNKHDGLAVFESFIFLDQHFIAVPIDGSYDVYFEPEGTEYYGANEIPIELLGVDAALFPMYGKVKNVEIINLPQNSINANNRLTQVIIKKGSDKKLTVKGTMKMRKSVSTDLRPEMKYFITKDKKVKLSKTLTQLDWITLDELQLIATDNEYDEFSLTYSYKNILSEENPKLLLDFLPDNLIPTSSGNERVLNYYGDFKKKEKVVMLFHNTQPLLPENIEKYKLDYENKAGKISCTAILMGPVINIQLLIEYNEYNFTDQDYPMLLEFEEKVMEILSTTAPVN